MFGRSILAAPVVEAQFTEEQIIKEDAMTGWDKKEVKAQQANRVDWSAPKTATKYLPKGSLWYDFWTNQQYKGGQTITIPTPLDRVPMREALGSA